MKKSSLCLFSSLALYSFEASATDNAVEALPQIKAFGNVYKEFATRESTRKICDAAQSDELGITSWGNLDDVVGAITSDLTYLKTGKIPSGHNEQFYDKEIKKVDSSQIKEFVSLAIAIADLQGEQGRFQTVPFKSKLEELLK